VSINVDLNNRPDYDGVIQGIAAYVLDDAIQTTEAFDTARNALLDVRGCALQALRFPGCAKHQRRHAAAAATKIQTQSGHAMSFHRRMGHDSRTHH
jgi:2-methylcitrate dehydratase PrpD